MSVVPYPYLTEDGTLHPIITTTPLEGVQASLQDTYNTHQVEVLQKSCPHVPNLATSAS
jgi:hypothetical protein